MVDHEVLVRMMVVVLEVKALLDNVGVLRRTVVVVVEEQVTWFKVIGGTSLGHLKKR
jgi:hypothetical protein